jgi:hypothetical protein
VGYNDAPDGWWQEFVGALPARTAKLAIVRKDESAHIAPVWVDLDGDTIVFMTSADTIKIKGKAMGADQADAYGKRNSVPPRDGRPSYARNGDRKGQRRFVDLLYVRL